MLLFHCYYLKLKQRKVVDLPQDDTQKFLDQYYLGNDKAPCCAGCDHWQYFNSLTGECKKSAPMSGNDRVGLLGVEGLSLNVRGGHALTTRDHSCGEFIDTYDWDGNQK